MILYLAGGHHTDPLCRWRLHEWLEHLQRTHGGPPAFVAVEWSQEVFERGKRQRPLLRQQAESEWPDEEPAVWDTIAGCLCWEGDAHVDAVPDAEVIWLDEGDVLTAEDQLELERLADTALTYLWSCWSAAQPSSIASLLEALSREAWQEVEPLPGTLPPPEEQERDRKWADRLLNRTADDPGTWAVVVVGAGHTHSVPGSLRQRLEAAGQRCEVRILGTR